MFVTSRVTHMTLAFFFLVKVLIFHSKTENFRWLYSYSHGSYDNDTRGYLLPMFGLSINSILIWVDARGFLFLIPLSFGHNRSTISDKMQNSIVVRSCKVH